MAVSGWQGVSIAECGEGLVMLDAARVAFVDPHPYIAAGAPYPDDVSPFMLRAGAADRVYRALDLLQQKHPGYGFLIFDGLRPLAVQRYMVDLTLADFAQRAGKDAAHLSDEDRARLMDEVLVFWSVPSDDPARPPLHSTGGAIDLTIIDARGAPLDMGTVFDHFGPEAATHYFAGKDDTVHANRMLLCDVMFAAGFTNYAQEWWHFDYGTPRWAFQTKAAEAIYGRVDLLTI